MRSFARGGLLLGVGICVGCAHAAPAEPAPKPDADPVVRLRQDNAALRRRVQMLEDRLVKLEHRADPSVATMPRGRDLPVVKLQPQQPGHGPSKSPVGRQPPRWQVQAKNLGPLPNSGGLAGPLSEPQHPQVEPIDQSRSEAQAQSKSFRLVGTRLVELTEPDTPKKPDRPASGPRGQGILGEYRSAMERYRAGAVVEAESAFSAFAQRHPKHDYADNALYWKGEAAYDQNHYADALAAFTEVVERYGGGNKAPDALLKIGLCYRNLGDAANAHDVLSQLIIAYPGARASDIARARLAEFGS